MYKYLCAAFLVLTAPTIKTPANAIETPPKLKSMGSFKEPKGAPDSWVVMELTLSAEGNVTDAQVLGSYPRGLLEKYALNEARKFRFRPRMRDGIPMSTTWVVSLTSFSGSGWRFRAQNAAPMREMLNAL